MPDNRPLIVLSFKRQAGLDPAHRQRLWHVVRSEILAALDACGTSGNHHSGGKLIGISEHWDVVFSRRQGVSLYARGNGAADGSLPSRIETTMRNLRNLVRLRTELLEAPVRR